MSQELLVNVGIGEVRIARAEDGRLTELAIEPATEGSLVGNIYLGRVVRVVANIGAAFVDIGVGRDGFLGAREAARLRPRGAGDDEDPPINELVSEGEAILVQVATDAVADKGAGLRGAITLPGQLLVHAPTQLGVVVSRRLTDEAERQRLAGLVEAGRAEADAHEGRFIVRTAAEGAAAEALREDIERLVAAWRDLTAARAQAHPPACLFDERDPIVRALRDLTTRATERIRIDSGEAFLRARDYCQRHRPDLAGRVEHFRGPGALFDHADIEADIEAALERDVRLPSGGAITIEETEALTAIDVDSGALTETPSRRETALRVNLEAAGAIGRQVRLRGIGGMIVVDFLDLETAADRARLASALEDAFAPDAARPRAGPIPTRGVVVITRARVRPSLWMQLTEPCPGCGASGRRPTTATLVRALLRRAERAATSGRAGGSLRVRAAPVVAQALEADRAAVELLERRIGRPIEIEAVANVERTHVEFEAG